MPAPNDLRARSYDSDMMAEGREGEAFVYDFLCRHPQVVHVEDVRGEPEWRAKDVDFRVELVDGRFVLVEAKHDIHAVKNNFFFEVLRINHTSAAFPLQLGWSARSSADYFAVCSPSVSMHLYLFLARDFRDAMRAYTFQVRSLTNWRFICTDRIKSTIGILIPKERVRYHAYRYHPQRWLEIEGTDTHQRHAS